MSKIASIVKNRFGGILYQKLRYYHQLKRLPSWPFPNCPFKHQLAAFAKLVPKAYFFSTKAIKEERRLLCKNLYKCLCELYTSKESDSLFDFNGIVLPKPIKESDEGIFAYEFLDILAPTITGEKLFGHTVCDEGPYEMENVQINPGDIVIDCGANLGMFAALASYKGARVYAFEPSKYIVDQYLSKSAIRNHNIYICNIALYDKEEQMFFANSASNIVAGKIVKNNNKATKPLPIQAMPLDTYVERHFLPRVDFIKADIEGAERNLLAGAKRVLKEFAPKIAICTYHLPDDAVVLRKLIHEANPKYVIIERFKKLYAYVPK